MGTVCIALGTDMVPAISMAGVVMDYSHQFSSMMISMFLPLPLSRLHSAINNPDLVIQERQLSSSNLIQQLSIVGLSVFNPLILINLYEDVKSRLATKSKENGFYFKVIKLLEKSQEINKELISFKQIQFSLEDSYQILLQILPLLLATTDTSTTRGFEIMLEKSSRFGKPLDTWLILTLCVGLTQRSVILLLVKYTCAEKIFAPMKLNLCSLFACSRKTLSSVAFSLLSLGLFSNLNHYKTEQYTPYFRKSLAKNDRGNANDTLQLYHATTDALWTITTSGR